jgi:syntaxin 5
MDEEEFSIGIPSQQQMAMVQQQDQYLSQRGQAIESIESTIHELGSIFQQLAQMVQEQSETVQRFPTPLENLFPSSIDGRRLTLGQDRCDNG